MSTEAAFRVLPEDPAPRRALLSDGVPVEVVLYLRNPGGLARSVHAQMVALRGLQADLDAFLDRFRFLDQVERFLDLAAGHGLPLWVWNYSSDPEAAIPVMAEILGLPPGTLAPPPLPRVNRSMTRAELRALQEIARSHGAEAAATVARALAAELPGQPPDPLQATAAAYGAFTRRLAPQVARINARLPDAARLQVEPYEVVFGTGAAGPTALDDRQRAVIAAALAGWHPGAADPLRDRLVRGLNARAPGVARGLRRVRDRLRG
jgi:hypothetical protein